MKTARHLVSLLTVLFVCSFIAPVKAQNNVLKFNPASLVVPNYSFFYERQVQPKFSVVLGGNYMNFRHNSIEFDEATGDTTTWNNSIRGLGFTLEGRYFPFNGSNDKTPGGFYVGGFVRAIFYDLQSKQDQYDAETKSRETKLNVGLNGTYLSLGPTMGYQVLISRVVAIDMFLSPDLNVVTTSADLAGTLYGWKYNFADIFSQSAVFPGLRLGVTAGIAF